MGSSAITAGANTTVLTATRLVHELLEWAAWVQEDTATSSEWAFDGFSDAAAIRLRFVRTANPNEFQFIIRNTAAAIRTIDWAVFGVTV